MPFLMDFAEKEHTDIDFHFVDNPGQFNLSIKDNLLYASRVQSSLKLWSHNNPERWQKSLAFLKTLTDPTWKPKKCDHLNHSLVVDSNTQVYPCLHIRTNLGFYNSTPIAQILEGISGLRETKACHKKLDCYSLKCAAVII